MRFKYQARTKEGEIKIGEIEAFSKEAAIEILQRYGLYPTSIEELEITFFRKPILSLRKISHQEIVAASRQLAILFRSGVPIVEALNSIAKEAKNPKLKEVFFGLAKEIQAGNTLSTALSRYPNIFSDVYISMIKSGEVSGELAKSLETIAETMEKNYYFISRLRDALIYPAIVFFLTIIIFLLVIFYLLPKLASFTTELGATPPFFAQLLINIAGFFKEWWLAILAILVSVLAGLFLYLKTPEGKQNMDAFLLRLPIIGNFLKMIYVSRIGTNLTILISGGIPIAQALEVVEEITGNIIYKKVLSIAKDAVRSGESVSAFFKDYPEIFPPFFSQMLATGEKAGSLTKALLSASNFYEKEAERIAINFTNLLGPILIVIMGGVVGLLLFVILMTIYQTITLF